MSSINGLEVLKRDPLAEKYSENELRAVLDDAGGPTAAKNRLVTAEECNPALDTPCTECGARPGAWRAVCSPPEYSGYEFECLVCDSRYSFYHVD